jgi:hypothetical protein
VIFAVTDDGGLCVHDSLADVQRQHEGIDVEHGDVRFFDADGRPLKPVFTEPNRMGHVLGFEIIESGDYTLESVPSTDGSEFRQTILPAVKYLEPNQRFGSLQSVRKAFGSIE